MADENYAASVRDFILNNKHPSYTTTNKKEVRVRCPYCGDSVKNPTSAHMYIEVNAPFRFHCFKCETSGVLNQQTLRDFGLLGDDIGSAVINANKNSKKGIGFTKISTTRKNLINTPVESQASQNAIAYFNNRYGTNYTNEEIINNFKCVTDAEAFFNENHIHPKKFYDFQNSIGFISSDNSHIIFRDISGLQEQRYYNLNLIPDQMENIGSKSYNITSEVSVLSNEVTLVITEGIFDIIGVYTHFFKDRDTSNIIFAAACGKAYNAVILKYIRMGFLNLKVVIFSDADVDVNFYRSTIKSSPFLQESSITIFYNSLYNPETGFGKDFGVPKDQIKLRKVII